MSEDSHRQDVVHRILTKVADAEGVGPEDLPPLDHEIDAEALTEFLETSGSSTHIGFRYHGWEITVRTNREIRMSEQHDDGPYIGQCNTCSEAIRDVDMETAQDFFASHADRGHAVELFRNDMPGLGQPRDVEEAGSREKAGTD